MDEWNGYRVLVSCGRFLELSLMLLVFFLLFCCCCCCLEARVYSLPVRAHVALDLATPQERAVAPFRDDGLVGLVAALAAHQVAAVHADGRLVARAPVSAQYAQPRVGVAEPGRLFQVHQILGAGSLQFRIVRFQLETVPVPAAAHAATVLALRRLLLLLLLQRLRRLLRRLLVLLLRSHRVQLRRVLVVRVLRVVLGTESPEPARVAHHHPGRAVEPVLEVVADRPEVGQLHPARFHGARARHTVTLALLFHFRLYVLKHTNTRKANNLIYITT